MKTFWGIIFTLFCEGLELLKTSEGYVFTGVCHSVTGGGGGEVL